MSSAQAFHATRREPRAAICIGQLLHTYTRKLGLVRKIFAILPNHLMKIQEQMGNTVNTSSKKIYCVFFEFTIWAFYNSCYR